MTNPWREKHLLHGKSENRRRRDFRTEKVKIEAVLCQGCRREKTWDESSFSQNAFSGRIGEKKEHGKALPSSERHWNKDRYQVILNHSREHRLWSAKIIFAKEMAERWQNIDSFLAGLLVTIFAWILSRNSGNGVFFRDNLYEMEKIVTITWTTLPAGGTDLSCSCWSAYG